MVSIASSRVDSMFKAKDAELTSHDENFELSSHHENLESTSRDENLELMTRPEYLDTQNMVSV